ncbi:MAG: RluA family pseudouridine synthase [Bacillota bacterium]|nr:RluA family pseudouridine synthase [Bacillota bacterium]
MPESLKFSAQEKKRIDVYVSAYAEDVTRSYAQKLIEEEKILVNGKKVKHNYKTKIGDIVTVEFDEPEPITSEPENIPINIVYEDSSVLVINKERGMVVHPAPGNVSGTLVNAILYHCKGNLSGINGDIRPGIVHRIDKDTTGLLVIAKNDKAHQSLTKQLSDRSLSRVYYALVNGNIKEDEGTINAPIDRNPKDRKLMAVVSGGREAITDFEVMERFGAYTLVKCKLKTGRTHQIRVHMKHIGHSVVGDKAYGIKNEKFKLLGQLLHAKEITFVHPDSGERVHFEAPLPQDFLDVLNVLRKQKD